jgi:ubiquinone/menaquinone biosynthesis C-methylase UbiE
MATTTNMKISNHNSHYALGYTNAEHERLIRQAARIAPVTERLFREVGIGPGQRVLDLGSGVGDVAMLAARLVGPSGEIVGIEQDASSIARAEARVASAGLRNVKFTQRDVNQIASHELFDAAIGRFILIFLPDPLAVLRSVARLVRPGGVLAFQEASWAPMLALGTNPPLWSKVLSTIHQTFLRAGVNPELGLDLYRLFQEVGLPAPTMHMELILGGDAESTGIIVDLLRSLLPLAWQHNISLEALGDFATLAERVHAQVAAANRVVSYIPLVGAWSRKPA